MAAWRVLVFDRSGDDPKWIIATVSLPSDVRAAEMPAQRSALRRLAGSHPVGTQPGRPARPARAPIRDRLAHRRRRERRVMTAWRRIPAHGTRARLLTVLPAGK